MLKFSQFKKIEQEAPVEGGEPSKGIPSFWYNVLNSVTHTADMIKVWNIFWGIYTK